MVTAIGVKFWMCVELICYHDAYILHHSTYWDSAAVLDEAKIFLHFNWVEEQLLRELDI